MGITQIPYWVQGALEEIYNDMLIDTLKLFIYDVGAFTFTTETDP